MMESLLLEANFAEKGRWARRYLPGHQRVPTIFQIGAGSENLLSFIQQLLFPLASSIFNCLEEHEPSIGLAL
jgi:hypothetical protein